MWCAFSAGEPTFQAQGQTINYDAVVCLKCGHNYWLNSLVGSDMYKITMILLVVWLMCLKLSGVWSNQIICFQVTPIFYK